MLEGGRDDQVPHGDLFDVGLIGNSPGSSGGGILVVGTHSFVILHAVGRFAWPAPALGVIFAGGPLGGMLGVIKKTWLCQVVLELAAELSASR